MWSFGESTALARRACLIFCDAELGRVEELGVGPEADGGAGVALADRVHHLEVRGLVAVREGHVVHLPAALDPDLQLGREGVDHRDAHAVEAAREAVALVRELGAGVQPGEDHLDPGHLLALVEVDRHAAAVVGHREGAVVVQGEDDLVAVAGDGLVGRVVDHLLGEVVRPVGERVHAGALAHRLQSGQDFDGGGVVGHRSYRSETIRSSRLETVQLRRRHDSRRGCATPARRRNPCRLTSGILA